MKKNNKYVELASQLVQNKIAQKTIVFLIASNANTYLFFSGVFVSISVTIALDSINIQYELNNICYLVVHFSLMILSFLATLLLANIANILQKVDITIADEYCRLKFDQQKAQNKKNEFENILKDAFRIQNDLNNEELTKQLLVTYLKKGCVTFFMVLCILLLIGLIVIKQVCKC